MDEIQQKNYSIKGICSKNKKMNIKCSLMKQVVVFLALLGLKTIIFTFLFYSKKKIKNNFQKIYKRKLEELGYSDEYSYDTNDYSSEPDIISDTTLDTLDTTNYIIEINQGTDIINNCTGINFFENICRPNNINKSQDLNFIEDILNQIKDGEFTELFNRTIEEDTYFINSDNNITYQISTVSSQYSANNSTVSLEKCELMLKDIYSINKDEKLILLKLEHYIENIKIPIIEYQLFTKDGQKLNLSYCDNIPEIVSIPVNINEREEFIHDPNSDFYQDRCYTYTSEYGTDLSLFDRKNNFNEKFLSLCEKDCIYQGYNNTNKTVKCECKTKIEFPKYTKTEKLDIKELLYQFIDFKKLLNLYVLTCPKVLFTSKGLKKNFGSYFNIAIIAVLIIFLIFFYLKGNNSFKEKINNIIDQKIQEKDTEYNIIISDTQTQDPDISLENYNDYEINNLGYDEALKLDKRTYCESYVSKIKLDCLFIFTFLVKDDYNSTEIKICLFLFWLSLDFTVEALFFTDSTMHKIYEDKGKYNFLYQLPKIIYRILISNLFKKILQKLSLYEDKIAKIVNDNGNKNDKKEEINNLLQSKARFTVFFIILILLLLFFWYYLSSFCAVFKNTQIPLIKDIIIGYISPFPFIYANLPCALKFWALKRESICLYKFSGIIEKILDFIL